MVGFVFRLASMPRELLQSRTSPYDLVLKDIGVATPVQFIPISIDRRRPVMPGA